MKVSFYAACFIAVSLAGCGHPPSADYSNSGSVAPLALPANQQPNNGNQPLMAGGQSTPSTAALNPAHGLPGHRCDIDVGAPLSPTVQSFPTQPLNNAPAANTTQPQMLSAAEIAKEAAPANVTKTNSGSNPAHGLPGHRCDIPVGAPLSSPVKNVQEPAASKPVEAPVKEPAQMFPAPPSAAAPAAGAARLNPAHGQPGHDCSVQVGQPLK